WIYLVPRRCGFRTTYTLQLTLELQKPLVQREYGEGEAVVNLRWSAIPATEEGAKLGGIVVAEINGESFAMSGSVYGDLGYARYLRGTADELFDEVRAHLVEWMKASECPEWLKLATS